MVGIMAVIRLLIMSAVALFVSVAAAGAQARSDIVLKLGCFAGPFGEAMQKYAVDLFTRNTGIKVEVSYANPPDFVAQLIAAKGRKPPYDVVALDDDITAEAIKAGVLAKLDPTIVTQLKNLYPQALNKDGYGPSVFFFSIGIAYNEAKLKEAGIAPPKTWNDIWDPRFAGRIAIPDVANIMGRDLVIQASRMAGGDEKTPEKGIEKLGQIKAHSYYVSSTTLQAQLESGDVWVAPWNNMRAWSMTDRGIPIRYVDPADGPIGSTDTIQLAANTPYPKEAQLLINYILDPFAQLGMSKLLPTGPTNMLLADVVKADAELKSKAPVTPDDLKALYLPDLEAFNTKLKSVNDLWNRMKQK